LTVPSIGSTTQQTAPGATSPAALLLSLHRIAGAVARQQLAGQPLGGGVTAVTTSVSLLLVATSATADDAHRHSELPHLAGDVHCHGPQPRDLLAIGALAIGIPTTASGCHGGHPTTLPGRHGS
jgi:hypothetical protein